MAGRKSSAGGLQIKVAIVCCFILTITAGIGAYTMPIRYDANAAFDSSPQMLAKRSAAVLNKYILQTFRHQAQQPVFGSGRFQENPLLSEEIKLLPIIPRDNGFNLERRGTKVDRRTYVRCYFNAVSCF